ncbi:MAG: ferritin-like domain-containing protein, partial [Salinivenus sp.]
MSDSSSRSASRRQFLQQAGGVAGLTALTVAGCDSGGSSAPDPETVSFDFSNDFGVLNYAYALEQLEAAFYAEATANFYGDLNSVEGQYFQDLAAHEGLHRDFLAAAIPALGGELISDLEVDFNDVDFGNRSEVLATARLLEDTGVRAYKGQAPMLAGQD